MPPFLIFLWIYDRESVINNRFMPKRAIKGKGGRPEGGGRDRPFI